MCVAGNMKICVCYSRTSLLKLIELNLLQSLVAPSTSIQFIGPCLLYVVLMLAILLCYVQQEGSTSVKYSWVSSCIKWLSGK